MDNSVFLAGIIGPYMLIAGIGLLVNRSFYRQMLDQLRDQSLLLLSMGAFTLILGLLMVRFHNIWTLDWRVLVTLIGWIALIKGAMAMIAPASLMKFADIYAGKDSLLTIQAVLALLFGAFMSYMGYLA